MLVKYTSLHYHISSNKNVANGGFISPKKIFVSSQSSKRCERTHPHDSYLTSAWRRKCSCWESILSHNDWKSLELSGQLWIASTIFTESSRTSFNSGTSFFDARCSRSIIQCVKSKYLWATYLTLVTAPEWRPVMAAGPTIHMLTQFPQSVLFSQKYLFRSWNISDPVVRPGKLMLQRSSFLTSVISLHSTKQSRTAQLLTSVDSSSWIA